MYTDSDAVYNCEYLNGLNLYSMELIKGDIIGLPDGRALPVGSALEDGLLKNNLKNGVYVMREGVKHPVFSAVPSIYFRMSPTQERGTLIRINEEKYRFDIERAIKCNTQDKTDEHGYILRLSDYSSPRLTVSARIVGKRQNTTHNNQPNAGDISGAHGYHTISSTSYYITFQVESGDRMELSVSGTEYGMLSEGDTGKLTFQGTRYLDFNRNV